MTRALRAIWDMPLWTGLTAAPFAFLAGGILRGLVVC
ncbi:MAG: hypothetical protein QOJ81_1530 [Chloroflexota bacterium]|jgi:hypothetical protein|nr:hypothetical protein [Chloroflexota bacterium]